MSSLGKSASQTTATRGTAIAAATASATTDHASTCTHRRPADAPWMTVLRPSASLGIAASPALLDVTEREPADLRYLTSSRPAGLVEADAIDQPRSGRPLLAPPRPAEWNPA